MIAESEAHLISRCLRGETAAWDELFDLHYAATRSFVLQLGFHFTLQDAEEISQEVFLSVVRNLRSFRRTCQFQTWLFQIAVNKARDYRQRLMAAKRGSGQVPVSIHQVDPETGRTLDLVSHTPRPDIALLDAEMFDLMGEALENLNSSCREIIELRYFGELSYEEISKVLGLNTKTVSTRLSASLTKLKRNLDQIEALRGSPKTLMTRCKLEHSKDRDVRDGVTR